jgi:hypothetical protein
MIGIPDAVTLQLVSPFKDGNPCRADDILFDMSSCRPSWSENFDFFFTLLKVSYIRGVVATHNHSSIFITSVSDDQR